MRQFTVSVHHTLVSVLQMTAPACAIASNNAFRPLSLWFEMSSGRMPATWFALRLASAFFVTQARGVRQCQAVAPANAMVSAAPLRSGQARKACGAA